VTDTFGTTSAASNALAFHDDQTPPMATVSAASSIVKVGQTDLITFNFSEPVTGFDNADLLVSGGTLGAISQVDTTHYTATFTPTAGVIQTATIQVGGSGTGTSSWTDLAGNGGKSSNTFTISEDTQPPTVAPDRTHVQENHSVTANAAQGVLANDIDPIAGDSLKVSAVNGQMASVGHPVAGAYGTLKLNADGSYSYAKACRSQPASVLICFPTPQWTRTETPPLRP
jgi:Bacterial Ig-like domain